MRSDSPLSRLVHQAFADFFGGMPEEFFHGLARLPTHLLQGLPRCLGSPVRQ